MSPAEHLRLRVAYLADQYPRREETFIQREIAELRTQGVHVQTFALRASTHAEDALTSDQQSTFYLDSVGPFRIVRAHAGRFLQHPIRYLSACRLAWRMASPVGAGQVASLRLLSAALVLADCMKDRSLGHLHNHATGDSCTVAVLAAAIDGLHFSFTVHGPGVFFAPAERRLSEKLARARFVRCISFFTRSQCLMWAPVAQWPHLHVVHCGVDANGYAQREHRGAGSQLLFVGRLAPEKGLPFLIEAFAQVHARRPSTRLTIVGDGRERTSLEALARSAGVWDQIQFAGYQTPNQVAEQLRRADVFVLASLAEGVPAVLMEAMAAAVPVVATSVGGVSELVEDGVSGFLVPASSPEALADCIERLLDDGELRSRLGHAGREKVIREFNLDHETARLRDLFEWALAGGPAVAQREHGSREVLGG